MLLQLLAVTSFWRFLAGALDFTVSQVLLPSGWSCFSVSLVVVALVKLLD